MNKKSQGKASLKLLYLHVAGITRTIKPPECVRKEKLPLFQYVELENPFGLHCAILTETDICTYL